MAGTHGPLVRPLCSARPAVASYRFTNWPRSIVFRHRAPVQDIPPCFEVIGATVLIFEVVRVFPHIDTEDGRVAVHQRAVLIWGGDYLKPSIFPDQPRPSTSETTYTSSAEFFLKFIEAAERGFDVISEFAFRFAAGIRSHDFPKERVI